MRDSTGGGNKNLSRFYNSLLLALYKVGPFKQGDHTPNTRKGKDFIDKKSNEIFCKKWEKDPKLAFVCINLKS